MGCTGEKCQLQQPVRRGTEKEQKTDFSSAPILDVRVFGQGEFGHSSVGGNHSRKFAKFVKLGGKVSTGH